MSAVDRALETLVVPSFTNIGYSVRSRLHDWRTLTDYDLSGRTVAITGPTSGIGQAAARAVAAAGADLILIARNRAKLDALAADLARAGSTGRIRREVTDLASLRQVRETSVRLADTVDRLDVLIHNAGSMFDERTIGEDGIELTVAVHVVAPFLMTGMLLDRIAATPGSRVVTVSSGGMYAAPLAVRGLEMRGEFKGSTQYALAKRAQVTLNEMWAGRPDSAGVRFHAMHPGWADTPGVRASLPLFRRAVGPLLRSPEQGADTVVWLAADDTLPLAENGGFWHDRERRPIHRLARTRRSDTPERRAQLWDLVAEQAGAPVSR